QAGGGAPHLAQQAAIDPWRLFAAAREQKRRDALVEVRLLIAIQATGDAAPEDPPVDFALHLVGVLQAAVVNPARLLHSEIVAGKTESGTQAESAEIEPAGFEGGTVLPAVGAFEKHVGELADGSQRRR